MMRVGLAMLQGARHEHEEAILSIAEAFKESIEVIHLRRAEDLDTSIHGLVLPGGESTTMRIASRSEGLLDSIYNWMEAHPNRPVLGHAQALFCSQCQAMDVNHLFEPKFREMHGVVNDNRLRCLSM